VVRNRVVYLCSTSLCYENAGASGEMYMLVMVAYVSLSPARYEIFAGLVDCDVSLGEAAHFGKTFGCLYSFFEMNRAVSIDLLECLSLVDGL
jgi:hypothetical protein